LVLSNTETEEAMRNCHRLFGWTGSRNRDLEDDLPSQLNAAVGAIIEGPAEEIICA
jgi:hypothetical protein